MLISLFIAFILLFYNIYLDINYANKTQNKINIEKYSSREALITLGNIIILIIILQILFTTSYPIVNKLFNINLSIPPNRIQFYNNILVILFIPLLITTVLSSLSSYKMEINISSYNSKFLLNLLLAIVIISLLYYYCPIKKLSYNITLYLLILLILVSISSKKLSTQSKLSHIGFATMFIGITIAFSDLKNYNKETSLYLHYNKIICNSNYKVIYNEISSYNRNTFFNISVIQKKDTINLKPFVTSNINYGRLFQPYIKNTFFNDWFAYITYIDSSNHLSIDTSITLKDSLLIFGYKFKFNNIKVIPMGGNNNIIISAYITVSDSSGKYWNIRPDYLVKNDYALSIPSTIRERSIEIYFSNVLPKENTIQIKVNKLTTPSINIKLIKYPLVWIIYSGFFIMFVGFILSLYKKFKTVKYGSSLSD